MLIEDRLTQIKTIVDNEHSATIDYLAKQLNVSKDTIRRDLIKLEERNKLRRTHGGAVANEREALIYNYEERAGKYSEIKEKIAIEANRMIEDDSSILFDSSTTVEAVIRKMNEKKMFAITNSLTHAMLLARFKMGEVSLLPGKLHKEQLFLFGSETIKKIEQYKTDYTVLGVFALSEEGLFIHTEEEGLVKRQMIKQANTVIAVADHTKLDKTGFFKICNLNEIDILITDQEPNETMLHSICENDVKLIVAQ